MYTILTRSIVIFHPALPRYSIDKVLNVTADDECSCDAVVYIYKHVIRAVTVARIFPPLRSDSDRVEYEHKIW